VAGNEEGHGIVCISMLDMPEGKGRASEARWDSTTFGDTSVEMGQHLDGFCDSFATDF